MTFILGISGKKQSGKDTLLANIGPKLNGLVKKYSFADGLKNFLVEVMGLSQEQVWGTDEQKNTITNYTWENIPEFIRWENGGRWVSYSDGAIKAQLPFFEEALAKQGRIWFSPERLYWELALSKNNPINLKTGKMSARELMQVFGTDICRRMFSQYIWVNATFNLIKKDKVDFAVLTDLRFPSELSGVCSNNANVVRLTRDVSKGDQHPSEIALDNYNWNSLGDKVLIVPNNLNIDETADFVWSWLSTKIEKNKS